MTDLDIALATPGKSSFDSHDEAEIGRETTTYSVSAIAPAETAFDWPNTVT